MILTDDVLHARTSFQGLERVRKILAAQHGSIWRREMIHRQNGIHVMNVACSKMLLKKRNTYGGVILVNGFAAT